MKRIKECLFNSVLYKTVCVCAFMLVPSIVFCFFSQAVSAVLLLWGALFLLRDLKNRNFLRQTGSLLLVLFCLGYVVTLVLYAKNDFVSTLHVFFWTILEFFVLFAVTCENKPSPKSLLQEMYRINIAICVVGLLAGLASLVFFFLRIAVVMPDPEGLNTYWFLGVISGRNSGIFNNPIPCANAMFIAMAAALFNLLSSKKKSVYAWVLYILTVVVCYTVVLTTLTRTYVYGVYLFVAVAVFFIGYQYVKESKKMTSSKVVLVVLGALLSVALLIGLTDVMKKTMVEIVKDVPAKNFFLFETEDPQPPETEPPVTEPPVTEPPVTMPTDPTTESTRPLSKEELEQQISNQLGLSQGITMDRNEVNRLPSFLYPRDELWKVALDVIPHSPIFGFSSGNRESTSLQYNTGDYLKTNRTDGITTYHNAYFDIAVSAGLLGLGLLLAFLAVQIFRTLRTAFRKRNEAINGNDKRSFGVLVAYLATHVFVSCMFFGVLCFCNVSVCLYFWVIMGYVSKFNDLCNGEKACLSANNIVQKVLQWKNKK